MDSDNKNAATCPVSKVRAVYSFEVSWYSDINNHRQNTGSEDQICLESWQRTFLRPA